MLNEPLNPIPKNFTVTENFGEMIIEYKWSRLTGVIVLIFSLIWNGMLFFILAQMPPEFRPFITIHALAGIVIFYLALCHLLNTTTITCDNESLKLKTGPIPAFNNKVIAKNDIQQLYFVQKVSRGKNGTTITYQLRMMDKNNRSVRLIRALPDPEAARFVELKLEKFFKIKNVEVAGQFDDIG